MLCSAECPPLPLRPQFLISPPRVWPGGNGGRERKETDGRGHPTRPHRTAPPGIVSYLSTVYLCISPFIGSFLCLLGQTHRISSNTRQSAVSSGIGVLAAREPFAIDSSVRMSALHGARVPCWVSVGLFLLFLQPQRAYEEAGNVPSRGFLPNQALVQSYFESIRAKATPRICRQETP